MARKHGSFDSVHDAILSTAADLFTNVGVHAASLNDIAAAARLSKGTLYYYYPQKEQLVSDVARMSISADTDTIFTWVDSLSRDEELTSALYRLMDLLTADLRRMRLHTVLIVEAACGNAELSELFRSAYREWTVMLEVGALKLKSQNSRLVHTRAQLFFACLDGYMLQHPAALTTIEKDEILNHLFG